MLHKMDIDTMRQLLRQENPAWADSYIQRTAVKYVTEMDGSLDEPLWTYAKDGHKTDLRRGEFSLLMILALQPGCGYVQAAAYLDAYIKDPVVGKALILRR